VERLTAWEGISTDGLPAAVLVRNERTFNENMAAALRKLARYEDMEEARERGDLEDGRSV
jgi:hypothetical protein